MPPADPLGQSPAVLLSAGLGVERLTPSPQAKEASYTDLES